MVDSISSSIEVEESGIPSLLNARKNVFLVPVKEITPRVKGSMSPLLLGVTQEISYKVAERLYSNPLILMVLNNLFISSVGTQGIDSAETSGDSTGYSLTVAKQYRPVRKKRLYRQKG